MLHQGRHILTEQRKRRVRDHDVRLVEQRQTLLGAEVAITIKLRQLVLMGLEQLRDVEHVHAAVPGHVIDLRHHGLVRLTLLVFVAAHDIEQRELLPHDR